MADLRLWPLAAAVIAAFIASAIWYILFAKQRAKLSPAARESGRPQPKLLAAELAKNIILVCCIAYFLRAFGVEGFADALHVALAFWIAFPVLILMSSVMYEKVPFKLAAIHAGDWLIKLVLIVEIITLWR